MLISIYLTQYIIITYMFVYLYVVVDINLLYPLVIMHIIML